MRTFLLSVLSAAAITAVSSSAFAWSCVATASDGAQGWSSNYANEKAAERRAIRECEKYANTDDCEVQNCVPDNGKS
jgi:hypothetical protein